MNSQFAVFVTRVQPDEMDRMLAVVGACAEANVSLPDEVADFFYGCLSEFDGDIDDFREAMLNARVEGSGDPFSENGMLIQLDSLPPDAINLRIELQSESSAESDSIAVSRAAPLDEQMVMTGDDHDSSESADEEESTPRRDRSLLDANGNWPNPPPFSKEDFERCGRMVAEPTKSELEDGSFFLTWVENQESGVVPMVWKPTSEEDKAAAERFYTASHWRSWTDPTELYQLPRLPGRWLVRCVKPGINSDFKVYVTGIDTIEPKNTQYNKDVDKALPMSHDESIRLAVLLTDHFGHEKDKALYFEPVRQDGN